ncbi:MAG: hypothetical protein JRD89_14545 [Deltaproteobacteria bacterium]|nr:hypothetical protein [Deltaproteobacteria bacterium]
MTTKVRIILEWAEKNKGVAKNVQGELKSLGMTAAKVLAGVALVGVGLKKAFDLGREGAAVVQTAESFEYLMVKVGAMPGLLNELRDASHGTVSDMQLMSSTSTLLAGTSGTLAKSLADNTPRLMEIAKAANKLNPALGTTTFMYESLAKGIKRSSPLILDNLGVVVKVGEANQKYADILGKSVTAMTAAEKQQALLNAVLEAGGTLIDQVGGNTEAATDKYDIATAAIENYKNAFLANISTAEEFGGALNYVTRMAILAQAETDGLLDKRLFQAKWVTATGAILDTGEALEYVAKSKIPLGHSAFVDLRDAAEDLNAALDSSEDKSWNFGEAVSDLTDKLDLEQQFAGMVNGQLNKMAESATHAAEMKLALKLATEELTEAEKEELKQQMQNVKNLGLLNKQWEQGIINDEQYLAIVQDGFVVQEELDRHLAHNQQSWGKVAERSHAAALGMDKARRAGEMINGRAWSSSYTHTTTNIEIFKNSMAYGKAAPEGLGKKTDYRPEGTGGQFGLSGVVPPGYPGDSFPINVQSGETVDVKTRMQQKQDKSDLAALTHKFDELTFALEEMGDRFDVSSEVASTPRPMVSRGIQRNSPMSRLAMVGQMRFALNNADGKYSPGHVSAQAGFGVGNKCRLSFVFEGATYYKFYGRIPAGGVNPLPGTKGARMTTVFVKDWMAVVGAHEVSLLELATNKRLDEMLPLIDSNLAFAPLAVAYSVGQETFPAIFNTVSTTTKAIAEIKKGIISEASYYFVKGDQTGGETVVAENRYTRSSIQEPTNLPMSAQSAGFLLKQDGDYLLKEDGDRIVLNASQAADFDNNMYKMKVSQGKWLSNYVKAKVHPTVVDSGATTVLYSQPEVIYVEGQTTTMVRPAEGTDYQATAEEGGGGDDLKAFMVVTVSFGTGDAEYTIRNSGNEGFWVQKFQFRGDGVYDYAQIETIVEDEASQL